MFILERQLPPQAGTATAFKLRVALLRQFIK